MVNFWVDFWGEGGIMGTQGVQGPQGVTGAQGAQGSTGPVGPEGGFTTDCGTLKSLASVNASGVTFDDKIDQTFLIKGGTYFIWYKLHYQGSNSSTQYEFRLEINGNEIDILPDNTVGVSDDDDSWSSFELIELPPAVMSFKLQFRQPGGGGTLSVSRAKIGYLLVKPFDTGGVGGSGSA